MVERPASGANIAGLARPISTEPLGEVAGAVPGVLRQTPLERASNLRTVAVWSVSPTVQHLTTKNTQMPKRTVERDTVASANGYTLFYFIHDGT